MVGLAPMAIRIRILIAEVLDGANLAAPPPYQATGVGHRGAGDSFFGRGVANGLAVVCQVPS
jgi:hypothetical protein